MDTTYDVVVIGSGFGGSVAALRLTEKGYKVGVLEAGRRFADHELPKTSWRVRRFLWAPRLGCFGIQKLTLLRNVLVLSGTGVGGGSLVYANTLYEPLAPFYSDPQWRHITDWRAELAPYYDQAKRMLGVVTYQGATAADVVMREVARDMGVPDTFHTAPVGVYFGQSGVDPYFGGAGPVRDTCIECGGCMTGCRHNAKNTLVKNYLWLAERAGAVVHPLTTVTEVRPMPGGGYRINTVRTGAWNGRRRSFHAHQVIFAAGALGTQRLLHRMRDKALLTHLSPRLGHLTRTNSEAILGSKAYGSAVDYSKGVAITSSFHPDPNTHIEPVRYGKGSNLMGLLQTFLTDGGTRRQRSRQWLREAGRNVHRLPRLLGVRRWSEKTIIALVMQSLDNSITVFTKRTWYGRRKLTSRQGHGRPNPTSIPAGNDAARRIAEKIDGYPGGTWLEIVNIPMTAHILGGAVIGDSPDTGVIDPYHRVYGHPGLHVVDGAAVSANLGVNPSLTITAQAERAMSFWPNHGEPDPRPALGGPYRSVRPVLPGQPVVPDHAPAALRLPLAR
ncbi:MAG TPA: GMC family oxidoreductase [Micromonosporaceae bacterium]|jgi:cholesterol oxidase|nr:GMC family oxidoreductase [Micromonosporaceae bacterium]